MRSVFELRRRGLLGEVGEVGEVGEASWTSPLLAVVRAREPSALNARLLVGRFVFNLAQQEERAPQVRDRVLLMISASFTHDLGEV